MADEPVTYTHGGVEYPENQRDRDYDAALPNMGEEELLDELSYWSVYERRLLQLSTEIQKRKNKETN